MRHGYLTAQEASGNATAIHRLERKLPHPMAQHHAGGSLPYSPKAVVAETDIACCWLQPRQRAMALMLCFSRSEAFPVILANRGCRDHLRPLRS